MTPLPPHIAAPRLLFYAVNGLGLGHVTRMLAIARAVRAARPGAQILFVTTTEADHVIYREGFASVKLPSRTTIQSTGIQPGVYNKLAQTVVMNTVAAFNPAILISDTFPGGASQELLPTLSWSMRRVFVYRAQLADRAADPHFQTLLTAYDLAVIPHEIGSETFPIPPTLRTVWTGPILIRARAEALPKLEARRRLGLPDKITQPLLYITVGGGGDDEMAQSESLIVRAAKRAGWLTAAPDAPLLKSPQPNDSTGEPPDFRVSYYPMAECLPAFDAAVSAAGYNSVAELLHFHIPSLLVPRERGLDDQFARAKKAEAAGAAFTSSLSGQEIEEKLAELIKPNVRDRMQYAAGQGSGLNGAEYRR